MTKPTRNARPAWTWHHALPVRSLKAHSSSIFPRANLLHFHPYCKIWKKLHLWDTSYSKQTNHQMGLLTGRGHQ